MPLTYRTAELGHTATPDPDLVRALQRDLRALGYLARGIDGKFLDGTRQAVRRLQFDLLRNDGRPGADGPPPVAVNAFNRGVTAITGIVDQALADSIEALLADPRVTRLPNSDNPAAANRAAIVSVRAMSNPVAPIPFMLAIFVQESDAQHYAVPQARQDSDSFVTLGLDHNAGSADQVTSRGYGLGQYTIFHHPPRAEEVVDFILDPITNVRKAFGELRDKFDHFIAGSTAATQADDRMAEHPLLSLRLCRYGPSDARYLTDCRACAGEARKLDITRATPLYPGSSQTYGEARYYSNPNYSGVPDRAAFRCDWPYAVRRYNGSGPDSFNYQARVLLNVLTSPIATVGDVS